MLLDRTVPARKTRPTTAQGRPGVRMPPTGHMTLLRRRINVTDVDSTSQQRRVPSGRSRPVYFIMVNVGDSSDSLRSGFTLMRATFHTARHVTAVPCHPLI